MQKSIAGIWAFRVRSEEEAAARFARLASRLGEVGASTTVIDMAARAASDEARHAELCRDLVRHFGHQPPAAPNHVVSEVAPSVLGARERVLYEVVSLSCITETLSAAFLGAMVERAQDARVRTTVHEILRDEIEHGRLGWAHLSLEQTRGDVLFLGSYLPAMLESTVTDELFVEGAADEDVLAGFGALARNERRAIFEATMAEVVFPGLRRFGVATSSGEAWLARKASTKA
jgi:hypothetical protein